MQDRQMQDRQMAQIGGEGILGEDLEDGEELFDLTGQEGEYIRYRAKFFLQKYRILTHACLSCTFR